MQGVRVGDFVVHGLDILRGSAGVSDADGAISSVCVVCLPVGDVDPRYFAWQIRAQAASGLPRALARGVREGGADFRRWDTLAELPVLCPPPGDQRVIADYLDARTAKIASIVEKKRRMLSLETYRETSLLCSIFLPQFAPGSRDHVPLKRLVRKVVRPASAGAEVVTAFRDGTVTLRSNRREEGFTFSATESTYVGVEPGDLVFHGLDGFEGAVGVADARGKMSPVNHSLLCDETLVLARYLALVLRAMGRAGYLAGLSSNVRQRAVDFRNFANLGEVTVPLPSVSEQGEAVAEFDNAFGRSNRLRTSLSSQLELLAEYRHALITAAVTGQLDTAGRRREHG